MVSVEPFEFACLATLEAPDADVVMFLTPFRLHLVPEVITLLASLLHLLPLGVESMLALRLTEGDRMKRLAALEDSDDLLPLDF